MKLLLKKNISLITAILSILVLLIYINFALGGISFSLIPSLILAISIGIVAIIGAVEIYKELSVKHKDTTLILGTIFLIIGFSFFILMVLVQQAVVIIIADNTIPDTSTLINEPNKVIFQGLNYIQLGIDVAFDVFYSLGLVFVSLVMVKEKDYTRYIGLYGIISGIFLAGFNIITFPIPPSQAGLFDIGPFTIIWWLAIIVLGVYENEVKKKQK